MTCELHFGDCLDILRIQEADSFDAVITDPPYGVTGNAWDVPPPLAEWWKEIHRVAKASAVIVVFAQHPFTMDLIASNRRHWRYELIWHKSRATGFLDCRRRPLRAHEHIQIFCRSPRSSTYNPQMVPGKPVMRGGTGRISTNWGNFKQLPRTLSDGGRYPRSVLDFASARDTHHPTQKPLPLVEWLVRTYSNPGDRVLDCYMGSGTTGVACLGNERRFVGIEKCERFFGVAQERMQKAA